MSRSGRWGPTTQRPCEPRPYTFQNPWACCSRPSSIISSVCSHPLSAAIHSVGFTRRPALRQLERAFSQLAPEDCVTAQKTCVTAQRTSKAVDDRSSRTLLDGRWMAGGCLVDARWMLGGLGEWPVDGNWISEERGTLMEFVRRPERHSPVAGEWDLSLFILRHRNGTSNCLNTPGVISAAPRRFKGRHVKAATWACASSCIAAWVSIAPQPAARTASVPKVLPPPRLE